MKSKIRIGSRRSPLALWQAEWVVRRLQQAHLSCELVPMDTTGDRMLNVAIPEIGNKGVFTMELEQSLSRGEIDLAVHSAKDMPSDLPKGFEITAFTLREKAHDVLVSYREDLDLKADISVGTSSTRRAALLKYYYPEIRTNPVRGNLQTRLKKLESGNLDALILAFAGVRRLGLDTLVRHAFPLDTWIPAVGQGSLAIEVSTGLDSEKKSQIKKALNDPNTECCLIAERAFLFKIQGGCSIPAFAYACLNGKTITIRGGIVSLDGKQLIQLELAGPSVEARQIGESLGQQVLESGGAAILKNIKSQMNANDEKQT